MNYIVTRHAGALAWIRRRLAGQSSQELTHLVATFAPAPGDRVFGVLPLPWVERIHCAAAEAWVLEVEMPASLRGQELSEQQLDALHARLVRYEARAVECLA